MKVINASLQPLLVGLIVSVFAFLPVTVSYAQISELASFNNTDGAYPASGLTLDGSNLYGTTTGGGLYGDGTVFSVPLTGGTVTTLASFNGSDGSDPQGGLILAVTMQLGPKNARIFHAALGCCPTASQLGNSARIFSQTARHHGRWAAGTPSRRVAVP